MASQKERMQFIEVLFAEEARACPLREVGEIARKIMRNAATHGRLAEEECGRELTEAEQRKVDSCEERIGQLCARLGKGFVPQFSGDPRGYTVKIRLPSGRYNNWGGEAWGVPGS